MIAYSVAGDGRPVVLLHAFPCDRRMWQAQADALADSGCRVVSVDLRGFGASPLGHDPASLDRMADDVIEVMDEVGFDTAVIGGLSIGGYVVMNVVRRHPGRASGIVLADTKATADAPAAVENRLAMAEALEASGVEVVREKVLPNLVGATTHASRPEVMARVHAWIDGADPRGLAWAQRAMALRPDSLDALRGFGGPALVLWGAEDVMSPLAEQEAMIEALRAGDSEVTAVEIPAAGHLSAVESPAEVSVALLDWLA